MMMKRGMDWNEFCYHADKKICDQLANRSDLWDEENACERKVYMDAYFDILEQETYDIIKAGTVGVYKMKAKTAAQALIKFIGGAGAVNRQGLTITAYTDRHAVARKEGIVENIAEARLYQS